MTERQMWLKIAEAFDQYAQGAPITELTSYGLCNALSVLLGQTWRDYHTPEHDKIGRLEGITSSSWLNYGRRNAAFRATVAGFLAAGMDP